MFGHRLTMLVLCALATVVLGYFAATRLALTASFERMIPQGHPLIKNFLDHRKDLRGLGNSLRVVVENPKGDIYDPRYHRHAAARERRADAHAGRRPCVDEVAVGCLRCAGPR